MAKTAFITGATSGIGLASAKALAKEGYELALAARSTDKLEAVKKEIEKEYGIPVMTYTMDVRNTEEMKQTVADFLQKKGAPDVLLNNAGLARGLESYEKTAEADILQMLDTNIRGLFLLTHEFLPAMTEKGSGHIVNLGSTAGLYAYPGAAVYCATKAAVKTFSDGIRMDVIDTDIRVTTIQPGLVETNFSKVRFHGDEERAANVYAGIEALQAEDIADAVAYVVTRPKRMQVTDIVIMANQQAAGFMVSKNKK